MTWGRQSWINNFIKISILSNKTIANISITVTMNFFKPNISVVSFCRWFTNCTNERATCIGFEEYLTTE